jgi:hypothetical protein
MEKISECPSPSGILVIIGGKESKGRDEAPDRKTPSGFVKSDILEKFANLTGKRYANIQVHGT